MLDGRGGRLRDDRKVSFSRRFREGFAHTFDGRDVELQRGYSAVDLKAPFERAVELRVRMLCAVFLQCGVAQTRRGIRPFLQRGNSGKVDRDVRTLVKPAERVDDAPEPVAAARPSEQIHKIPDLRGASGNGVQTVDVNERRTEGALVLDGHVVKRAAVAVEPDQKRMRVQRVHSNSTFAICSALRGPLPKEMTSVVNSGASR